MNAPRPKQVPAWNDVRLADAYDLIAAVLEDQGRLSFRETLLMQIEQLDEEIGK